MWLFPEAGGVVGGRKGLCSTKSSRRPKGELAVGGTRGCGAPRWRGPQGDWEGLRVQEWPLIKAMEKWVGF